MLRRLSVEGAKLVEVQDAARLNTPDWLWRSWSRTYGEATARAIATAHLKEAPLDLTLRDDAEAGAASSMDVLLPTGTLRRAAGGSIAALARLCRGRLVGPGRRRRAAGAAVRRSRRTRGRRSVRGAGRQDRPARRRRRSGDGGRPLDPPARTARRQSRAARPADRGGGGRRVDLATADRPVDAVLLDAPCSTTGAIRRHPDVPHLKLPEDVARLSVVQDNLLRAAVDMLRPGGILDLLHLLARARGRGGADRGAARRRRAGRTARDRPPTRSASSPNGSPRPGICGLCPAISPNTTASTASSRPGWSSGRAPA